LASDAACKPELIVFNDVLVVYPGSLATLLTEYARVNSWTCWRLWVG
jgi:hypothetical protein